MCVFATRLKKDAVYSLSFLRILNFDFCPESFFFRIHRWGFLSQNSLPREDSNVKSNVFLSPLSLTKMGTKMLSEEMLTSESG